MIMTMIRIHYVVRDKSLIATLAVIAVNKLLKWMFLDLASVYVVDSQVSEMSQASILVRSRNPSFIYQQ